MGTLIALSLLSVFVASTAPKGKAEKRLANFWAGCAVAWVVGFVIGLA